MGKKNFEKKSKRQFEKKFEKKVKETIKKHNLVTSKDKIVVAMSGGKDSTTVAFLLKKLGYNVSALHINLLMGSWSKENELNVKKFCKENEIPLHIYNIRKEVGYAMCYVKSILGKKTRLKQCTICGIIRRWLINKKARDLGATKLATGHNLDDEAQNVLMNLMKGNPIIGINLGPSTGILADKKFVLRIKPLYFIKERDVEKYSKSKQLPVLYQRCPCVIGALRHKIRQKLDELEKQKPKSNIKENLVKNFLKIQKNMRKEVKRSLIYCKVCGEPSRHQICKTCLMLKELQ